MEKLAEFFLTVELKSKNKDEEIDAVYIYITKEKEGETVAELDAVTVVK
jgi:hypothetical protein